MPERGENGETSALIRLETYGGEGRNGRSGGNRLTFLQEKALQEGILITQHQTFVGGGAVTLLQGL